MAGRTREESSAEREDWRVDGLPGQRSGSGKKSRSKGTAPAQPRRLPSKARKGSAGEGSEWLPATGRKRKRSSSRNGRGNGRAGIGELERRAKELERELRKERRRARAEIEKLRSQLRKRRAAVSPSGRLDANAASFEQLRELGLTPTQSAKLISRRESAGGFKAKADLRRIPGLSKSARELIEKRLSVRR